MSPQKPETAATKRLLTRAEQAAYRAYDLRVEEMKQSGLGVLPHSGNNQKMIVSYLISLLADNDFRLFRKEVQIIREKAMRDPVHFSPLAHAVSVVQHSLLKRPARASH